MRSLSIFALALSLGLATACEDAGQSCELAQQYETVLEIGSGERDLELIDDLDRVPVSTGPQGGAHIWIGIQTSGIAPGRRGALGRPAESGPDVSFDLLDNSGARIGDGGVSETPLDGDENLADLVGAELYIDAWNDGDSDELYTLRASLLDRCGTELITERHVYLDW